MRGWLVLTYGKLAHIAMAVGPVEAPDPDHVLHASITPYFGTSSIGRLGRDLTIYDESLRGLLGLFASGDWARVAPLGTLRPGEPVPPEALARSALSPRALRLDSIRTGSVGTVIAIDPVAALEAAKGAAEFASTVAAAGWEWLGSEDAGKLGVMVGLASVLALPMTISWYLTGGWRRESAGRSLDVHRRRHTSHTEPVEGWTATTSRAANARAELAPGIEPDDLDAGEGVDIEHVSAAILIWTPGTGTTVQEEIDTWRAADDDPTIRLD